MKWRESEREGKKEIKPFCLKYVLQSISGGNGKASWNKDGAEELNFYHFKKQLAFKEWSGCEMQFSCLPLLSPFLKKKKNEIKLVAALRLMLHSHQS